MLLMAEKGIRDGIVMQYIDMQQQTINTWNIPTKIKKKKWKTTIRY